MPATSEYTRTPPPGAAIHVVSARAPAAPLTISARGSPACVEEASSAVATHATSTATWAERMAGFLVGRGTRRTIAPGRRRDSTGDARAEGPGRPGCG